MMKTNVKVSSQKEELSFLAELVRNMPAQSPEFVEAFAECNLISFSHDTENGALSVPHGRLVTLYLFKPKTQKERLEIETLRRPPLYGSTEVEEKAIKDLLPALRVGLSIGYYVDTLTHQKVTHVKFHDCDAIAFTDLVAVLPTTNQRMLTPKGGFHA